MVSDNLRETRVLSAVVSLVDSLLDDFDVVDLLTELTERCAELLDVASAGFLLADPLQRLHLVAATSEQATWVPISIAGRVSSVPRPRPASPLFMLCPSAQPAPCLAHSVCLIPGPVNSPRLIDWSLRPSPISRVWLSCKNIHPRPQP
jgi:hypothetical protein